MRPVFLIRLIRRRVRRASRQSCPVRVSKRNNPNANCRSAAIAKPAREFPGKFPELPSTFRAIAARVVARVWNGRNQKGETHECQSSPWPSRQCPVRLGPSCIGDRTNGLDDVADCCHGFQRGSDGPVRNSAGYSPLRRRRFIDCLRAWADLCAHKPSKAEITIGQQGTCPAASQALPSRGRARADATQRIWLNRALKPKNSSWCVF
jgi:hypothetical protein